MGKCMPPYRCHMGSFSLPFGPYGNLYVSIGPPINYYQKHIQIYKCSLGKYRPLYRDSVESFALPFGSYGNLYVSIWPPVNLYYKIYRFIKILWKNVGPPVGAIWKTLPCHLAHMVTYMFP